ncbi:MAG TPA: excinuclease ABC subunit UvrC [Gammaproteobacteria bacterium]|nr:excinuclease ABC subunit UvrC [Gammaproteobacteria bacterium]
MKVPRQKLSNLPIRLSPDSLNLSLGKLPHHPGVYQLLGENGEILYVGKAKDLKKRITSYFNKQIKDPKTRVLVTHIKDIDITVTNSETEAILLECNLIKKYKPRYNILLRDDKSYPYIVITQHHFPRIDLYRGIPKKNGMYFGPYPNAFAAKETIDLLQKLFQIRTCTDNYFRTRSRPCLLYQIGRCTGPCVGLITHEEYVGHIKLATLFLQGKSQQIITALQAKMELVAEHLDYERAAHIRDQMARLRQIQERQHVNVDVGNVDILGFAADAGRVCLQLLSIRDGQLLGSRSYFPHIPTYSSTDEIISAFLMQHYLESSSHGHDLPKYIVVTHIISDAAMLERVFSEQAKHHVTIMKATRGEKKKLLMMATKSAEKALLAHLFIKANMHERQLALQQVLDLATLPRRIECFDISHSMGEATVASCVVFDENGPLKQAYRQFNIEKITAGDDVAAMHQVLQRRFKRLQRSEAVLPDVVLIDGGAAQLAAAENVLTELAMKEVVLVGVAKGVDRKPGLETLHISGRKPMHLPADSLGLHFIQQIRDEAHRFAITSHRHRRDKKRRQSRLELIPGIGAKRRRELLRYFGGIQGLAHASLEELAKVPGIHDSLAKRIFAALHDTTI